MSLCGRLAPYKYYNYTCFLVPSFLILPCLVPAALVFPLTRFLSPHWYLTVPQVMGSLLLCTSILSL